MQSVGRKQSKIFRDNAEEFAPTLETLQKKVDAKILAFLNTLEMEKGKLLNNAKNKKRVLIFQMELKRYIENAGMIKVGRKLTTDVPKMLRKL